MSSNVIACCCLNTASSCTTIYFWPPTGRDKPLLWMMCHNCPSPKGATKERCGQALPCPSMGRKDKVLHCGNLSQVETLRKFSWFGGSLPKL